MTVYVKDALTKVARDLHEQSNLFDTVNPALWTPDEMISYIHCAETAFFSESGVTKYSTDVIVPAVATRIFSKPAMTMILERISINGRMIRKVTSWDLERQNYLWRSATDNKPRHWHEDHLPITQIEFDRIPREGDVIRYFHDMAPAERLPYPDGYDQAFIVADEWEPYIRWEVLSMALAKDGDAQDLGRSAFAHKQFEFGIALAVRLMHGSAGPGVAE